MAPRMAPNSPPLKGLRGWLARVKEVLVGLPAVVRSSPSILLWALLVLGVLCGVGVWAVSHAANQEADRAKATATQLASHVASWYQTRLYGTFAPAAALTALVKNNPSWNASSTLFQSLAPAIAAVVPGALHSLQLIPAGVIRQAYPPAAGAYITGLDILGHSPNPKCGAPCGYNSTTGTKFWGFVVAVFYMDALEVTAESPLGMLKNHHYLFTLTAPPPDSGEAGADIIVASHLHDRTLVDPVRVAVPLLDMQWVLSVCKENGTWWPAWYPGAVVGVVVAAIIVAALVFAVLVSRQRNRMLLRMLLPRELLDGLKAQDALQHAREVDGADTPADVLSGVLSCLLLGEAPDLRDVVLLRTVLHQGRDVYRPFNLGGKIKAANLDSDVAGALMAQLGGSNSDPGGLGGADAEKPSAGFPGRDPRGYHRSRSHLTLLLSSSTFSSQSELAPLQPEPCRARRPSLLAQQPSKDLTPMQRGLAFLLSDVAASTTSTSQGPAEPSGPLAAFGSVALHVDRATARSPQVSTLRHFVASGVAAGTATQPQVELQPGGPGAAAFMHGGRSNRSVSGMLQRMGSLTLSNAERGSPSQQGAGRCLTTHNLATAEMDEDGLESSASRRGGASSPGPGGAQHDGLFATIDNSDVERSMDRKCARTDSEVVDGALNTMVDTYGGMSGTFGSSHMGGALSSQGGRLRLGVESLLAVAASPGQWQFNMFQLAEASGGHALSTLGFFLCVKEGLVSRFGLKPTTLARLLRTLEAGYTDNPYHNATHAADVLRSLHVLLMGARLTDHYLDPLGLLAAYIAAIVHDLGHPGLTGDFLVATSAPLALRYNDKSPLESHHASAAFTLIAERPELDALAPLSKEQRSALRKMVIDLVLGTDMKQHFAMIAQYKAVRRPVRECSMSHGRGSSAQASTCGVPPPAEANAAVTPEPLDDTERMLSLQMCLKAADLGHLGSELEVHKRWLAALEEEFFLQGDREKALGLPISPLFDRSKQGASKSQVGFFDFVALPLIRALGEAFLGARPIQACFEANYAHWKEVQEAQQAGSGQPSAVPLPKVSAAKAASEKTSTNGVAAAANAVTPAAVDNT
ncbi:hypothetical protein HYH03_014743 [Edaphochlamys debaryana]|uniref:PDEase domain-containing protein n=1 Tax=Edaphochlamys debaryana TaxID=47281 RepID=A0A835XM28_9CHLO|nr:hypothetical protein HYH03_014743 [Edaphochlamys debaryana]|eukprot:KAG2486573.1 hypothetical protein HYH03_014743 [Edaphochlamys debaryana]